MPNEQLLGIGWCGANVFHGSVFFLFSYESVHMLSLQSEGYLS